MFDIIKNIKYSMTKEYKDDEIDDEYNYTYKLSKDNRLKKLSPTTGKFWCGGCDGYLVGEGEKCNRCGFRNIKNRHIRLKKD